MRANGTEPSGSQMQKSSGNKEAHALDPRHTVTAMVALECIEAHSGRLPSAKVSDPGSSTTSMVRAPTSSQSMRIHARRLQRAVDIYLCMPLHPPLIKQSGCCFMHNVAFHRHLLAVDWRGKGEAGRARHREEAVVREDACRLGEQQPLGRTNRAHSTRRRARVGTLRREQVSGTYYFPRCNKYLDE